MPTQETLTPDSDRYYKTKLNPKLRMIANGSYQVNAQRAQMCGSISVDHDKSQKDFRVDPPLPMAEPMLSGDSRPKETVPEPAIDKKPEAGGENVQTNVFIELSDPNKEVSFLSGRKFIRKGSIATVGVSLNDLKGLADQEDVIQIEMGQPLTHPRPIVTDSYPLNPIEDDANNKVPHWSIVDRRFKRDDQSIGGILIGIIDVEGFDFTHPDFLDKTGKTRFERIWDQGANYDSQKSGSTLREFGYGREIIKERMDAAILDGKKIGVPPYRLELQSQMSIGSHGTHVASIAAGNYGVCPTAKIAAVLIDLPDSDNDRRKSFYDSTRIAHAVDYLFKVGKELGLPVSINISLGTNGHAHDGSAFVNRWIDTELSTAGRFIAVAAGNAGQESPQTKNDLGYIMGRIHTSGQIVSRGLKQDIEWLIVGNTVVDQSENELEIWYSPQDRFSVQIKPPDADWLPETKPGQFLENYKIADGTRVSIYNELYFQTNGQNTVSIYISPDFSEGRPIDSGIKAGKWIVRLTGLEIKDGKYHGWIERDDPRPIGTLGMREFWNYPSFFNGSSNVDNTSLSSLACGNLIVSVANMDSQLERINISSSQGPTRDGRNKPEVAAPGTDIVAAKGFAGSNDLWISMTGTSMASPYICGLAGLMLGLNSKLTAAQIGGIMMGCSIPLPGTPYTWQNDAGFGSINPEQCLTDAVKFRNRQKINED